jgi:hypothetical protein
VRVKQQCLGFRGPPEGSARASERVRDVERVRGAGEGWIHVGTTGSSKTLARCLVLFVLTYSGRGPRARERERESEGECETGIREHWQGGGGRGALVMNLRCARSANEQRSSFSLRAILSFAIRSKESLGWIGEILGYYSSAVDDSF